MTNLYRLGVIVSAVDQLTSPVGKMINSMKNLEKVSDRAANMEKLGKSTGMVAVGMGVGFKVAKDGIVSVISAGDQYVSGLKTLSTVTTSTVGSIEKSMQIAGNATMEWIKKHNTSMDQFLSTSYAMGSAGLNDVSSLSGTRVALALAKGTMADAASTAELLAMSYNNLGNKSEDVTMEMMRLGDQFAKTQQMFQLRNLTQLQEGLKYAVPTMLQYQNQLEEVNVVLGQLNSSGLQGSMAGTSFAASQSQMIKASRMLGFELAKNEKGGLSYIGTLENIQKKFGDFDKMSNSVKMALKAAFGEEGLRAVSLLLSKTAQMKGQVEQVRNSAGTVTMLQQKMEANLGDQYGILQNNLSALKVTLSKDLLPIAEKAVSTTIKFVNGIENFAKAHPKLTRTGVLIAVIGTGLMGITAAILAVTSGYYLMASTSLKAYVSIAKGFSKIKAWIKDSAMLKRALDMSGSGLSKLGNYAKVAGSHIKQLAIQIVGMAKKMAIQAASGLKAMTMGIIQMGRKAITTASTALPSLIASTWSFTAALLANPITWIIVGLVALGGAIYFAARHWDKLKEFAVNAISTLINWIKNIGGIFKKAGMGLWNAFVGGIKAVINKPVELVKAGLQKVRKLLPFSDAKTGPLSTLTRSGKSLITTIGAGIQKESGHLPRILGKELHAVGKQLNTTPLPAITFETRKPEQPKLPEIPDLHGSAKYNVRGLSIPEVSPIESVVNYRNNVPEVQPGSVTYRSNFVKPEIPDLHGSAKYNVRGLSIPEVSPIESVVNYRNNVPEVQPGSVTYRSNFVKPEIPELHGSAKYNVHGLSIPEVSPIEFEPKIKSPKIPDLKGKIYFNVETPVSKLAKINNQAKLEVEMSKSLDFSHPLKEKRHFWQKEFHATDNSFDLLRAFNKLSNSLFKEGEGKIVIQGPITIEVNEMNDVNDFYKALLSIAEGEA